MKKIVGILAAAAVAVSAFAVDFSAGMQLKANLFEYDGATNNVGAFKLWNENGKDDKPFIFSLSSDRVGGTIKIFDSNGDYGQAGKAPAGMAAHAFNIWFKPFDMVRVDLGGQDIKLNVEHITWWKGNIVGGFLNGWDGIGDWGYKATLNVDAFSVALAFLPANNAWWFSNSGSTTNLDETTLYVQYAADFGTINAIFDAKDTFKNIKAGVGFNGKFDALGIFADVAFFYKNSAAAAVDFDVSYSMDDFGIEAYFAWKATNFNAINMDTMNLATFLKVSYALNGGSLYFKFLDADVLNNAFNAEFHVGYDGNLGAMSYEVEALIEVGTSVKVSVPCFFRVGF